MSKESPLRFKGGVGNREPEIIDALRFRREVLLVEERFKAERQLYRIPMVARTRWRASSSGYSRKKETTKAQLVSKRTPHASALHGDFIFNSRIL